VDRVVPVSPVEAPQRDRREVDAVETAHVDVDLLRIGARHVERMNAAVPAEVMLRDASVEPVRRELSFATQELELLARHDQVKETLLGADRAVALGDAIELRRHAKADASAVTSALVRLHGRSLVDRGRLSPSDK